MTTASTFERRPAGGKILVGYVATDFGRDALRLGIALARERDVALEIVMVAPRNNAYTGIYPHDRGYNSILEEQIAAWLTDALALVPEGMEATARIVPGDSEAVALNETAEELNCDLIVVGARAGGMLRRFQMGAAVNTLLHSATVPIALAPRGYSFTGPITRVTAMFGPKPGTSDVIAIALDRARRREVPLRLISLVIKGEADSAALGTDVIGAISHYGNRVLANIASDMHSAGHATTEVTSGDSVEDALKDITWDEGEIVVAGSSRLATTGRLFIGSTAARMLRTIPVPMVVVPAGYMQTDGGEGDVSTKS